MKNELINRIKIALSNCVNPREENGKFSRSIVKSAINSSMDNFRNAGVIGGYDIICDLDNNDCLDGTNSIRNNSELFAINLDMMTEPINCSIVDNEYDDIHDYAVVGLIGVDNEGRTCSIYNSEPYFVVHYIGGPRLPNNNLIFYDGCNKFRSCTAMSSISCPPSYKCIVEIVNNEMERLVGIG
jgi:hypothetical protein